MGQWEGEREEAPLVPSHLFFFAIVPRALSFFDYSSHQPEPLWRGELKPIVQYHLRYTQLHWRLYFSLKHQDLIPNILDSQPLDFSLLNSKVF